MKLHQSIIFDKKSKYIIEKLSKSVKNQLFLMASFTSFRKFKSQLCSWG